MDGQTEGPDPKAANPLGTWGLWAVLAGGLALVAVFIHIGAPMTEPRPSAGTQIGEIAGEIKRSAWRTFLGLPKPDPEVAEVAATGRLAFAGPVLGVIAVILSLVSGLSGENRRYAVYGVGLGAGAIAFQYLWWLALLMAGAAILVAIVENIGDIFDL